MRISIVSDSRKFFSYLIPEKINWKLVSGLGAIGTLSGITASCIAYKKYTDLQNQYSHVTEQTTTWRDLGIIVNISLAIIFIYQVNQYAKAYRHCHELLAAPVFQNEDNTSTNIRTLSSSSSSFSSNFISPPLTAHWHRSQSDPQLASLVANHSVSSSFSSSSSISHDHNGSSESNSPSPSFSHLLRRGSNDYYPSTSADTTPALTARSLASQMNSTYPMGTHGAVQEL